MQNTVPQNTDRPKRILHLLPSSASGGAPINVARLMARSHMDHYVMTQRDDTVNWDRLAALAVAIEHTQIRRLSLGSLKQVLAFVQAHEIDIVHSHGRGGGLYGRLAACLKRRKSVHTFRGFYNRFRGFKAFAFLAAERVLGALTHKAIAVSHTEKQQVLDAKVMPAEKLDVVFNPVVVEERSQSDGEDLDRDRIDKSSFNAVSLSRISEQKDILTLIDVAKLCGPGVTFHIFGGVNTSDSAYAQAVTEKIASLGLSNMVLHGDVPGAAGLLGAFDVYVSTALWEGLPTAIVEAFLSGVPVVGTNCPGNVDLIFDRNTGLLCHMKDAQEIAASITQIKADKALAKTLSRNAQAFAVKHFDADALVRKMDDIYERL